MPAQTYTVYDLIARCAALYGPSEALVFHDQRTSFSDFKGEVDRTAAGFNARGLKKGDRVAILAQNAPEVFTALGAAAALGLVAVPVNWRLSVDELGRILDDVSPALTLADTDREPLVRELADAGSPVGVLSTFIPGEGVALADSGGFSPAEVLARDPFVVIHTAAMDGRPRGAVLTHGNLVASNLQTMAVTGMTEKDACLCMLPLFHIMGLNLSLAVMHAGGKNVILPKFDAAQALAALEDGASVMGGFPPMLGNLLEEMEKSGRKPANLRTVLGIESPETIRKFEAATGCDFWLLYGQTETSGAVTLGRNREMPGSAGRPAPLSRVCLFGEDRSPVPVGQAGEIGVRGPGVFAGYWEKGAMETPTFVDGWHMTGDLGAFDENGWMFFKGRKPERDLIKSGGENVYPAEVEQVLLEHEGIARACVIGVPDARFGEGIKAVCVKKPGVDVTPEEIMEFVGSRIARYKKPRIVVFADALPETPDGEICRRTVKEDFGEGG